MKHDEPVASAPPGDPRVVAYLTDVEGMWARLASFARGNPYVSLDPAGALTVRDGAVFVFGGDAIDRGPDSRRVVATLLAARARQPDRVVLLAGNRDINKLRLDRELQGHPPARAPADLRAAPALLRWILEHTMGAREAFEFRRDELVAEGGGARVGDDDVVGSFLADLGPGGALRAYLRACQLAYRHGATLYVHGGVTRESLGFVPGAPRRDGVDAWVAALNGWYGDQIAAYEAGALEPGGRPAWEPLVVYQAPTPGLRHNPESVVYSRCTDERNNPNLPAADVVRALTREGVARLVVGHTPGGDAPWVLREPGFELWIADNSRGRVAEASRVYVRDADVRVEAQAVLDGGERVEAAFDLEAGRDEAPLGRRTADSGHLVTARLRDGSYLLFRYGEGYRIEQLRASAAELARRTTVVPAATPS